MVTTAKKDGSYIICIRPENEKERKLLQDAININNKDPFDIKKYRQMNLDEFDTAWTPQEEAGKDTLPFGEER